MNHKSNSDHVAIASDRTPLYGEKGGPAICLVAERCIIAVRNPASSGCHRVVRRAHLVRLRSIRLHLHMPGNDLANRRPYVDILPLSGLRKLMPVIPSPRVGEIRCRAFHHHTGTSKTPPSSTTTRRPPTTSMAAKPAATCAICHENPSKYKCPTLCLSIVCASLAPHATKGKN
jgi:hypothetical protein